MFLFMLTSFLIVAVLITAGASKQTTLSCGQKRKEPELDIEKTLAPRSFVQNWKVAFNWVRYDPEKDAMFCTRCEGAGLSNAFTGVTGCKTWRKNALEQQARH
jgi:hypothetical protein